MQTCRILPKIGRKIVWADAGIWAGRGEIQASRAPNDFSRRRHISAKEIMIVTLQIKIRLKIQNPDICNCNMSIVYNGRLGLGQLKTR